MQSVPLLRIIGVVRSSYKIEPAEPGERGAAVPREAR